MTFRTSILRPTRELLIQFFSTGLNKVLKGKENVLLWSYSQFDLSPFMIYQGYTQGRYPLPHSSDRSKMNWYDPLMRGIIPVADFKIRNDLLRRLKKENRCAENDKIQIRVNFNFKDTIFSCAMPRGTKTKTWITPEYIEAVLGLHHMGIAHSVEAYQNGVLVGGLVGLSINGFFATLSLFHTVDNASKIAFCYLLQKLKDDGFKLHHCGDVDSWFTQYGMIAIDRERYREELMKAITSPVAFTEKVPVLDI